MKLTRKIKKRKDKSKSRVKKRKVVRKTKKNRKEFRRRTKSRRKKKGGDMFSRIQMAMESEETRNERKRKEVEEKQREIRVGIKKDKYSVKLLEEALEPFLKENNETWEDYLAKIEQKQSSEKGERGKMDQLESAIRVALNMAPDNKKITKTIIIKEKLEDDLKKDIEDKLDKLKSQLDDAVETGEDANELERLFEEFDIQRKRADSMIKRMQKEEEEMNNVAEAHAKRASQRVDSYLYELGFKGRMAWNYQLLEWEVKKRMNAIRAKETGNDDYNLYNKLVANTDGDPEEDFMTWMMEKRYVLAKREVNATNEQYIVAMKFVKSKRNNGVLLGQASQVDTTNGENKKGTFFDLASIKTPNENKSLISWYEGGEEEEVENINIRLLKKEETRNVILGYDDTFNKDEREDEENIWRKIHRVQAWEKEKSKPSPDLYWTSGYR